MDLQMVTVNRLLNKLGKKQFHIIKANLREITITAKASITMAMETITRASGKTVSITDKALSILRVQIEHGLENIIKTKRLRGNGIVANCIVVI